MNILVVVVVGDVGGGVGGGGGVVSDLVLFSARTQHGKNCWLKGWLDSEGCLCPKQARIGGGKGGRETGLSLCSKNLSS